MAVDALGCPTQRLCGLYFPSLPLVKVLGLFMEARYELKKNQSMVESSPREGELVALHVCSSKTDFSLFRGETCLFPPFLSQSLLKRKALSGSQEGDNRVPVYSYRMRNRIVLGPRRLCLMARTLCPGKKSVHPGR